MRLVGRQNARIFRDPADNYKYSYKSRYFNSSTFLLVWILSHLVLEFRELLPKRNRSQRIKYRNWYRSYRDCACTVSGKHRQRGFWKMTHEEVDDLGGASEEIYGSGVDGKSDKAGGESSGAKKAQ